MDLKEVSSVCFPDISITKYNLTASDTAGSAESVVRGWLTPTLHSCPKIIGIAAAGGAHL